MKKKLSVCSALLTGLIASSAFAGDASTALPVGFSQDGRYFSYIEFGTQDGSGYPYAMVKFLDVDDNSYSASPVSVIEDSESGHLARTVPQVRRYALLKSRKALAKLKISKGHLAEILASRKLTDLSATDAGKIQFSRWPIIPGLVSPKYEVQLTEKPAVQTGAAKCFFEENPVMLKLSVKNLDSGKEIVLQDDDKLPSSRGCVIGYRIQDVIAREDDASKVVVLLNVFTYGFEGADSRTMAVSGILPE